MFNKNTVDADVENSWPHNLDLMKISDKCESRFITRTSNNRDKLIYYRLQ